MDHASVLQWMASGIPFNKHLGLELLTVEDGVGRVRLKEAPHLLNHVGTQHAAALFAAGEAASGGAVAGAFADVLLEITPVARGAQVRYMKPARGPITAEARLEATASLRDALSDKGRVEFPVEVQLRDESGVTVAELTVSWNLKRVG